MTKNSFERIMAGLDDAVAIARGEADPTTYRVHVPEEVDVRAIRQRLELSQEAFAARFGFSVSAVREWEQKRRRPEATARVLLTVIDREPDAVLRALNPQTEQPARGEKAAETKPDRTWIAATPIMHVIEDVSPLDYEHRDNAVYVLRLDNRKGGFSLPALEATYCSGSISLHGAIEQAKALADAKSPAEVVRLQAGFAEQALTYFRDLERAVSEPHVGVVERAVVKRRMPAKAPTKTRRSRTDAKAEPHHS